ncbi:MAG: ArsC family reductase [Gammaproteobacteria bacterium]|nr:ArsC family reductase [Gammaproteobacteria bacterium]
MTLIYGIKNCDTVKKALRWLDEHNVAYEFHDYKKEGIDEATLKTWSKKVGWETLLNRRSATWRALPEKVKDNIDEKSAIRLMLEQPSIIKRPVLIKGGTYLVGFDQQEYADLLD